MLVPGDPLNLISIAALALWRSGALALWGVVHGRSGLRSQPG